MANGVNKAIIVGNLGGDPQISETKSGNPMANINVATSTKWKDQSGEWQEKTEWHRVLFFGKLAEIVGKYLTKGKSVYVEGRISYRKWQDESGVERYSTEIIADQMQMLSGNGGTPSQSQAAPIAQDKVTNEDIPF